MNIGCKAHRRNVSAHDVQKFNDQVLKLSRFTQNNSVLCTCKFWFFCKRIRQVKDRPRAAECP